MSCLFKSFFTVCGPEGSFQAFGFMTYRDEDSLNLHRSNICSLSIAYAFPFGDNHNLWAIKYSENGNGPSDEEMELVDFEHVCHLVLNDKPWRFGNDDEKILIITPGRVKTRDEAYYDNKPEESLESWCANYGGEAYHPSECINMFLPAVDLAAACVWFDLEYFKSVVLLSERPSDYVAVPFGSRECCLRDPSYYEY